MTAFSYYTILSLDQFEILVCYLYHVSGYVFSYKLSGKPTSRSGLCPELRILGLARVAGFI